MKKSRIIKEDGRYLIYYTFKEKEGERGVSTKSVEPPGANVQARPLDEGDEPGCKKD